MFKLHKHKSRRGGPKFDFQFSDFQLDKVPRGWDKLFVSLVSVETGKTIVKSGKASVKNGICRWTETLHESISISQEKGNAKELEGCLFNIVVAVGSSRSGILGEVTINLADYASSRTSVPLSLLLTKCNHGTSLQFKIQCRTPKITYRDAQSKKTKMHVEYGKYDTEIRSDASDGACSRSVSSMSDNLMEITSISQAGLSRDPSLSASDSLHSFDSIDACSGNGTLSPQNNMFGPVTNLVRQDSDESQSSWRSRSIRAIDDDNQSKNNYMHFRAAASFRQQAEQNSCVFLSPSHSNVGSSKGIFEAAEVSVEELGAEARMWERKAKILALDAEILRMEMSEQSSSQAILGMELSASQQESNGLEQEIEHLKSLEESEKKHGETADLRFQAKDTDEIQKEMEKEIRFLKESNANLTEQFEKTEESNIELLSILQELEAIVETQKSEIDTLSSQNLKLQVRENSDLPAKAQLSSDFNMEISRVILPTEGPDEQFPEGIHNIKIQLQQLQETQEELESAIRLLEKSVEEKDREIEREQDFRTQALLDSDSKWRLQVAVKEEEIMNLEAKLSEAVKNQENRVLDVETGEETDISKEISILKIKVKDLEKDCNELTRENLDLLLKLRGTKHSSYLPDALVSSCCGSLGDDSPCTCGTEVSLQRGQLEELKDELRIKETMVADAPTSAQSQIQYSNPEHKCRDLEIQLQTSMDKAVHLENELKKFRVQLEEQQISGHALQKQPNVTFVSARPNNLCHVLFELRKLLNHVLKLTIRHGNSLHFPVDSNSICCFDDLESTCNEPLTYEEQLLAMLDFLSKTNECFNRECNRCAEMSKYATKDAQEGDTFQEVGSLNEYANSILNQGPRKSDETIQHDLGQELAMEASEIKALKSDNLRKHDEILVLREQLNALEDQIVTARDGNLLLQENLQCLEREKSSSTEYLEGLKKEIILLSSSVEVHLSRSQILERFSSELGKGKEDLEQQLSDLEKENMQLSERISALEAQLRYLTDEKETCILELRHSESQSMNLRDEITRLGIVMEAQKVDVRQRLQNMQNQWLEAQEECEYLNKANLKLQSTAESVIEECTVLQKSNGELRRQNVELHKRCTALEAQLMDFRGKFTECSEKIEALEEEFLNVLEEVSLKEKSLNSELDFLVIEDREHREKVMQENISLNDMYLEKVVEVENLQRELVHLIDQISIAGDEQNSLISGAILEVSVLRADKAKLEVSLQELTSKFSLSQSKLSVLEAETEGKVQQLTGELTALRKNQDVLMTNHGNLLVSLESFKSSDIKNKSVINALEINLKSSKYERLQLAEEVSSLKEQLQRATLVQAEVLDLKVSLSETRFEYEKLKALFDLVCEDHEQLKTEKDSLIQNISSMQKSLLELEDCRRSKIVLEEKILRLEGDLSAREALSARDAELKFELSKFKRENAELQRKVKHLEQDQEEYIKKVHVLQEQLGPKSQAMHGQMNSVGKPADLDDEYIAVLSASSEDKKIFEIPGVENTEYMSKIQSLENELSEALEANDIYKAQLRRFLSEEQNCSGSPKTTGSGIETDAKQQGINMSRLELELRDLQERYFQMSLKYAEVEAQREELVLKLKSTNSRRTWFF